MAFRVDREIFDPVGAGADDASTSDIDKESNNA